MINFLVSSYTLYYVIDPYKYFFYFHILVNLLEQDNVFFQRSYNLENYLKTEFLKYDPSTYSIVPETKVCLECSTDLVLHQKKAIGFIVLNIIVKCNVYYGQCETEGCSNYKIPVSYTGIGSGLINYGNKFFVGVELIVEYMNLYAKNGLSFTAWFKNKITINRYADSTIYGDVNHIHSYTGMLHEAFCLGTTLFDYEKSVFFCCELPKIVSMDAIVNSVKNSRMFKFKKPWITSTVIDRCSKRSERQLEKLSGLVKEEIIEILRKKTITLDTIQKLRKCSHKGVRAFSFCFSKGTDNNFVLQDLAQMFGMMLTKSVAAANTLIPVNCVSIVEK